MITLMIDCLICCFVMVVVGLFSLDTSCSLLFVCLFVIFLLLFSYSMGIASCHILISK